jgi:nucleotide-binding universal stress UspA family protein
MRVLLPVDGSETADRAVDYFIKSLDWFKSPVEVHVLNVQHALPYGGMVSKVLSRDAIDKYHEEEGRAALKSACAKLDKAGVKYHTHIGIGNEADVIATYAKEKACDQICMGTRGTGSVSSLVLGSVCVKLIHLSSVPVLLVR